MWTEFSHSYLMFSPRTAAVCILQERGNNDGKVLHAAHYRHSQGLHAITSRKAIKHTICWSFQTPGELQRTAHKENIIHRLGLTRNARVKFTCNSSVDALTFIHPAAASS